MKAFFVHDNKFWEKDGAVYSYGHFAYDLMWKRYLKHFDEIVVGGRFYEWSDDECSGLSVTSGDHISFLHLPDLASVAGLKRIHHARKLIREYEREADFVIARLPSQLGSIACTEAKKLQKNYAVEVVGCARDAYMNHSLRGRLVAPAMIHLERKHVRNAPNVIYVSRHFLQERYPNNRFNIGCPDTNIGSTDEDVLNARIQKIERLDISGVIRIGLVGSLDVKYKGHDTAIRALSILANDFPGLTLNFLGGGSSCHWEEYAEQFGVANRVVFCGSLPGGKPVMDWLDGIDVFIAPSLQETLGRALIEAMSRACPAIGGAGTAVSEQLPDDCIHNREDAEQLAQMIAYMLGHRRYMQLCAEENFVRSQKYSESILEERRDYFWRRAAGAISLKCGGGFDESEAGHRGLR